MAEKKNGRKKKDGRKHHFSFSTTNQSTINQIFNQSGKMDYADVNDA